jgi:Lipase (class 3)
MLRMKKMKAFFCFTSIVFIVCFTSCKTKEKVSFISAKEAVVFNQLIYKDSLKEKLLIVQPNYEIVWQPNEVNGNYAVVLKNKTVAQYALIIRGSLIEFSEKGFQNFIIQDFNIFTFKDWQYTDTVKKAAIANGSYIAFENLLQLKDTSTNKSLEDFLKNEIKENASLIITGHSLGGNMAQTYSSYLWQKLDKTQRSNTNIISFGATAVGNKYFVKDLEEKYPFGERYEIEKDIAPKLPSVEKLGNIASILGVDSALGINKNSEGNISQLISIVSTVAKGFNIINEENSFEQSIKHQKIITDSIKKENTKEEIEIINIINDAYFYHKIDQYAKHFGTDEIDKILKK